MNQIEKVMQKYAGKNVVLAWSGGLDSNVMLLALLQAGANVTVVSLDCQRLPNLAVEQTIRKRFTAELNNMQYRSQYTHITHKLDSSASTSHLVLAQTIMLMTMLMNNIPNGTDVVLQAYVMGDDAISYLDDFKALWNAQKALWHYGVKDTDIEFPFAKVHKLHLAEYLNLKYKDQPVFNLNWSCEHPDHIGTLPMACKVCPSCLLVARFKLEKYHNGYTVTNEYRNPADLVNVHPGIHGVYYDGVSNTLQAVFKSAPGRPQTIQHNCRAQTQLTKKKWDEHRADFKSDIDAANALPWHVRPPDNVIKTILMGEVEVETVNEMYD